MYHILLAFDNVDRNDKKKEVEIQPLLYVLNNFKLFVYSDSV